MKKELIKELTQHFESAAHLADDVEFWYARDLQGILGYTKWCSSCYREGENSLPKRGSR